MNQYKGLAIGMLIFAVPPVMAAKPPILDNNAAEQATRGTRHSGAGAKFLSQVVPMTMDAGKTYSVVIQFRNTSQSAWSRNNGQRLNVRSVNGARMWGIAHVELDANRAIPPDGTATFRFEVAAPAQGGTYDFQWQIGSTTGDAIGEPTPSLKIVVNPSTARGNANAEFVTQKMSGLSNVAPYFTIWERGRPYKVSVMFKNNGSAPWNSPAFRLMSQNPEQNLTWTLDRVEMALDEIVKSGQLKAFNFTIISPVEPGIYNMQWQMFREDAGFFGEMSENIAVTVR